MLPVRIFGMDSAGKPFTCVAHTLDISPQGARIAGVSRPLTVNDVVGVQRGVDKARFRVMWTGVKGTRTEGHVGLLCIQDNKNIWNVIFEESGPDQYRPPELEIVKATSGPEPKSEPEERRRSTRYSCDLGLDIQVEGSDVSTWVRCTDISRGGCYVETRSPLPAGTYLYICVRSETLRIRARCIVRTSHICLGMGLEFHEMGEDDKIQLERLLMYLHRRQQPAGTLRPRMEESVRELGRLHAEVLNGALDPAVQRYLRSALELVIQTLENAAKSTQVDDAGESHRTIMNGRLLFMARSAQEIEADLLAGTRPEPDARTAFQRAMRSLTPALEASAFSRTPDAAMDWEKSFTIHRA